MLRRGMQTSEDERLLGELEVVRDRLMELGKGLKGVRYRNVRRWLVVGSQASEGAMAALVEDGGWETLP